MKRLVVLFIGMALEVAASLPASPASALPPCSGCVADFALYDPDQEDDGVWEEDVLALETFLDAHGFTHQRVDAGGLRRGVLGSGANRRFRALVEPGGWAYTRDAALGSRGVTNLRHFVRGGGGYVGFCAGAWAAVGTARWDAWASGWYAATYYRLRLFDGAGWGPFGWMPGRRPTSSRSPSTPRIR